MTYVASTPQIFFSHETHMLLDFSAIRSQLGNPALFPCLWVKSHYQFYPKKDLSYIKLS